MRYLASHRCPGPWHPERTARRGPESAQAHLGREASPPRYGLATPSAAPPDAIWNYNGGGADRLGSVIERASGKPLIDFAREALFEPLGIKDWEWKNYENGKIATAAGLRFRPRDAAKIGQPWLHKGVWNGRKFVPAQGIEQAAKPRFRAPGCLAGGRY